MSGRWRKRVCCVGFRLDVKSKRGSMDEVLIDRYTPEISINAGFRGGLQAGHAGPSAVLMTINDDTG